MQTPAFALHFGDEHDDDSKCQVQHITGMRTARQLFNHLTMATKHQNTVHASCRYHDYVRREASVNLAECHHLRLLGLVYQSATHCSTP